jgi:hypothetical protein
MPITYSSPGGVGVYGAGGLTQSISVFNVLPGDLMVLYSRSIFGNIVSVTGTLSGTWSKAFSVAGGSVAEVWYSIATGTGTDGITATGTSGSFIFRGGAQNFRSSSGFLAKASVLDTFHTGGPTASTSFNSGNITTATGTEFLVGYIENETGDSPTLTPTGSWTAAVGNGVSENNAAMYWGTAGAAGTYSFAGTIAPSSNWITGVVAFKPVEPVAINLLSNANVAVSAGSTIVNTGNTVLYGDLDLSPGSVASGFPPGIVIGTQHIDDATAVQSQLDLTTAYNQAAAATGAVTIATALDAVTLDTGVYTSAAGTFSLSGGTLTLDGQGDPNAVWIFQMATTLITSAGSTISLINGAQAKNVFWQVGSSATIGATNTFVGTILAHTSITVNGTGTTTAGGLLAGAAVNLSDVIVTVTAALPAPSPASVLPTSGLQGTTFNFTVTGTNFSTGTLSFSGTGITVNSYSVQNATTITASVTIAGNAALTARDVTVTNVDTQTGTLLAAFTVAAIIVILPYSVQDCRDYATFPNSSRTLNATKIYDVQTSSNPAVPGTDSRASKPVDSSTQPQNSRTPGTFGPGE